MSGDKRGPYKISKTTKRDDNVDVMDAAIFKEEPVTFEGEQFLDLVSGGRIHARLDKVFLFACTGQAPEEWVACLERCNLLSRARVEAAKRARH